MAAGSQAWANAKQRQSPRHLALSSCSWQIIKGRVVMGGFKAEPLLPENPTSPSVAANILTDLCKHGGQEEDPTVARRRIPSTELRTLGMRKTEGGGWWCGGGKGQLQSTSLSTEIQASQSSPEASSSFPPPAGSLKGTALSFSSWDLMTALCA